MDLMDIGIVILSFICLFLYSDRSRLVGIFLDRISSARHNEFIQYFHLFYSDLVFTILAALLVFLATLRLWKLMKFLLIIKIVEKTLLFCLKPILCVFLWQIIILFSYGLAGRIFFGDDSYSFRELQSSVITLLMRSLGFDKSFNPISFRSSLQFIYYISFMLISLLFNTMYITIITISYYDAQVYYSNSEDYTVIDYIKEKAYFYFNLFLVRIGISRLRGGEDEINEKLVYSKSLEHRFAKCFTLPTSRMEAMLFVTLCTLRNLKRNRPEELSPKDKELIKNTIVRLFRENSSAKNLFYVSNIQGFEKTLVDDEVFVKMEKIVEHMLTKKKKKKSDRQKAFYEKIVLHQKTQLNTMIENFNLLTKIVDQIEVPDIE